jgi:hypothetical protein
VAVENGDHRARGSTGRGGEAEPVEGVEHRLLGSWEVETQLGMGVNASPKGHRRLQERISLTDQRPARRCRPSVVIVHRH